MERTKKIVQYIHVNKRNESWTVHNSQGCFTFEKVIIKVPSETIYKPQKKDNPRFFIRCKGVLAFTDYHLGTIE
jgi:hypothetical protein